MTEDVIKDALRMMPYGFYSITSKSGDESNAMVANWIMQTSFTPRLIALGLAKSALSHTLISDSGFFAVNIFHKDDADSIRPYTKGRGKNPDKMKDAQYTPAPETGCPILAGAAAYLECKVTQVIDVGGDHDIVVAEVIGAGVNKPTESTEVLNLPHLGWSYAG